MPAGDGLIVRVRPRMACLSVADAHALAELAERYGNGLLDLTTRGNVQIRGVGEDSFPDLLAALIVAGLAAQDPFGELPLTVTPFPDADGRTEALVTALNRVARRLPSLPDKMGIVVDTGDVRWLADTSGDFRFEMADGTMVLRADGSGAGLPVTLETAGQALVEMATWFVNSGGRDARRMRRHVEAMSQPEAWAAVVPGPVGTEPPVGPETGHLGVAFGQITAEDLNALAALPGLATIVVTPWRSVMLRSGEGAAVDALRVLPGATSFLSRPDDPRRKVVACAGAPRCPQATVETRALAERLSRTLDCGGVVLHVSGCAKGCARQAATPLTLVGRDGAFDLVRDGTAHHTPVMTGLRPEMIAEALNAVDTPAGTRNTRESAARGR